MIKNLEPLFECVYDEYMKKVFSYFSSCFGSCIAEDLTQQVFLNLWKYMNKDSFIKPFSWKGWIFTTAVNVKNDYLRQKQKKTMNYIYSLYEDFDEAEETDFEDGFSIRAAFKSLKSEEADLLLLKNMGLSSREVSKILGISASAVRSRLQVAKSNFASALKQNGVEIDE